MLIDVLTLHGWEGRENIGYRGFLQARGIPGVVENSWDLDLTPGNSWNCIPPPLFFQQIILILEFAKVQVKWPSHIDLQIS